MKNTKIVTVSMIILAAFSVGLISTKVGAVSSENKNKIAVVSIPRVMAESKYAASMQTAIMAQKDSSLAELEKLKAQMEAVRADMETRKVDSAEHKTLKRELMQKRAIAEAQKNFLQDDLMAQNKIAMENLYVEIINVIKEISQTKGIELVLDSDELLIPSQSVNELTMMIQTHKVLHYAPSLDITDDVITLIDSK